MLGKVLVYSSFVLSILTSLFYFLSATGKVKYKSYASIFYTLLTAGVLGICLFLMSKILAHDFQYTYVWEYSSKELPTNYLFATFYAGQQGSFLLWTFWTIIIGYILIPYVRKKDYEAETMAFFTLIPAFLLLILIAKSPFDFVWESFPGQVPFDFTPKNGKGLNPVLQNYWITIHPPILFLGFSALSVPFAIALAGLFKRDFKNWVNVTFPWALFAAGILGFGVMLGGLWAYETLGWGGFWAWDPVENSSLLPWLSITAFVHTALVSKRNGGLLKTSFGFALLSFILVLYSSFLTRSGVLGDTSVHSFVSPGPIVYKMLLAFLVIFVLISVVSFFIKMNKIPVKDKAMQMNSKEFMLSLGSITLLCIAFIVFLGTSWPMIAELLGQQKASVDASWYNMVNLPLAAIMLSINGMSIIFKWKQTFRVDLVRSLVTSLSITIALSFLFYSIGIRDAKFFLLAFAVAFTIATNFPFIINTFRKSPKLAGGFIAHFGIALLILGAITSGGYAVKQQIRLKEGEAKEFQGSKIKFIGKEQIDKQWADREKFQYIFEISIGEKTQIVHPIVYWSDFNERKAPFFEPGIAATATQDIYISPYSIEYSYDYPPAILQKGGKSPVSLDSSIVLSLEKFDMSGAMNGGENGAMKVGAVVTFTKDGNSYKDTIYSFLDQKSGMNVPEWKHVQNSNVEIGFIQLIPNKENLSLSQAVFAYKATGKELVPPKEVFIFEASVKPFISLVWAGTVLFVLGFFMSIFKYIGNDKAKSEKVEVEEVKEKVIFTEKEEDIIPAIVVSNNEDLNIAKQS